MGAAVQGPRRKGIRAGHGLAHAEVSKDPERPSDVILIETGRTTLDENEELPGATK